MQRLIKGIQKFQSDVFRSKQSLFEKLERKQNPRILFITCSDSRIDPVMVTQSDPGDLFIMRNAGNIIPAYGPGSQATGEAATIEYAINALHIRQIVICGHSQCGAMYGLLNPQEIADLPAVNSFLLNAEAVRRIVQEHYGHLELDRKIEVATLENVLVQIQNLKTHPSVATTLSRGEMHLYAWYYNFTRGEINHYNSESGQFESITGEDINHLKQPPPLIPEPESLTAPPA